VLIKTLDSNERLTIQVHPDKQFARAMLNSAFGKTGYKRKTIFNESHTDCFALNEIDIKGEITLKGNGDFYVGVI
jgi:mannose-6-phosphate isomerase class I